MKVALYQMHIIWENKDANYVQLEEKLKVVCSRGIDLFLLPEMSFTGFSMNTDVTKEKDDRTIKKMQDFASRYNVAIGFGWVKDCGNKSENHYTVVNKNGKIISDYVKIHPFSYAGENERFQGGHSIDSFQLSNINFSNFICYDLRFPEIFQIASKIANVILVPANWPARRREHWTCLLRARALENQVYIIAINCVGEMNGVIYSGDSCIISPNGEVLSGLLDQEGVLEYELMDDVQEFRIEFPVKQDRREELYEELNNLLAASCESIEGMHNGQFVNYSGKDRVE